MRQFAAWTTIFHFKTSRIYAWWAVIIVIVISLLDLLGWIYNITFLKSVLIQWTPMKMITACCFLASTASLAISNLSRDRSPARYISLVLGLAVIIAGIASIYSYSSNISTANIPATHYSPLLDFFLSTDERMALITALLFSFTGVVLVLLTIPTGKYREIAHLLTIPVLFIAYVIPMRYIIEIHNINTFLNIPVAFNTAIAFCFLAIAILCFYPETRLMQVFTGHFAGSIMARRLLAGLLIIPIIIGWLRLTSERLHILSSDMGVAFVAVAYTFCLIAIVWLSARSVNETDKQRRKSEDKIRKNEQRLKYHFENSPLAIIEWDESFIVTLWSNEAERMFGRNACETLGKKIDSLNLIFEADVPIVEKTMQRLLSGQEHTVVSSNRNYTKSGEIIECIWYNSVLLDKDGHMTSVMSLVQDVTERRKAEKLLLQSREQYRMLVEMSPYAVFVNRNNKIVYVNPACLALFGASSEQEIKGRSPYELFHEDSHAIIEARLNSLVKGDSVPLNEERIVRLDKSVREVDVAASIFTDQDGQAIQVILHDVTENKRSKAKLIKLNQTLIALDKCSQAMVRSNDENSYLKEVCQIIIEVCHYTMVWIGYALEDADKKVLPMVHFGLDNGYLESQRISWADTERGRGPTGTAIRTGKAVTCRNMLTDPTFLPWREQALKRGYASSIALPLITNGKTLGALTIYSKIPDSFSEEEKELLTELANDLAYGITAIRWKIAQAKAEEQLQKYAEDLKELNATKDKFFGIIAHDLKNPFTSILGASEVLASNAEEFDMETIKKFSILLHDAGKNGYAMLENLLEWSRSQTGKLSYVPRKVNVSEVIQQNLDNLILTADQKEIKMQMSVPEDLYIMADLNMTHTILRNLLNNALKFTHRKGLVNICATQAEKDVIITIKDNGIGISEEDQKKLFRLDVKYTQIGTAEERGTGLGLLLCKEFIEKQGGTIWVESIPGQGSSFNFTLPAVLPVPSQTTSAVNSIPPEN